MAKHIQFIIFLFVFTYFHTTDLAQADVIAQSANKQVSLIELYSSEGCSSCPPAEQRVSLLSDNPGLWKDFVPAVFHVDYWDYLGWRDNLAQAKFTKRQKEYSAYWGTSGVYTPGFVLNGKEWSDWRKFEMPTAGVGSGGLLSIDSLGKGSYKIVFNPQKKVQGKYTVQAVLLASGVVSDVKSGENQGRVLQHDFTVVEHIEKNMKSKGRGNFEADIILNIPKEIPAKKWAVAAWVVESGDFIPLQATGAYLLN